MMIWKEEHIFEDYKNYEENLRRWDKISSILDIKEEIFKL